MNEEFSLIENVEVYGPHKNLYEDLLAGYRISVSISMPAGMLTYIHDLQLIRKERKLSTVIIDLLRTGIMRDRVNNLVLRDRALELLAKAEKTDQKPRKRKTPSKTKKK